jgi:hypothetical protein
MVGTCWGCCSDHSDAGNKKKSSHDASLASLPFRVPSSTFVFGVRDPSSSFVVPP